MRSLTSSPAALRVSCTARMTSRARPSASSSGVVVGVEQHEPAARQQRERRGRLAVRLAVSSTSSYSPSASSTPPAVTTPSVSRPVAGAGRLDDLLHVLAEARARARALTVSRCVMP